MVNLQRFREQRTEAPKSRRLERQILLMIVFFSISTGLWENFRQLWLESNNYTAEAVSNIISVGMVLGVLTIIIVGRFVKMSRIKNLVIITLVGRFLNLLAMYCINFAGDRQIINICILIDVITAQIVLSSLYPLLTTVMKSNRAYSQRKLVEYLFRDVGILIGGALIGRHLGEWIFDYNSSLLVAAAFLAVAIVIVYRLDIQITQRSPKIQFSALKLLAHNRIQRVYAVYNFLSSVSYATVTGLKILVLTNMFNFSAGTATNALLIIGLSADLIGILALKYFTPRNDYVTMTIKFGTRLILLLIALFSGNAFICFIAFVWMLLSSTAYENVSDGYYINMIDNKHQLKYGTFRHVISLLGEALGVFLCGQTFALGLPVMMGVSASVLIIQLAVTYYLIYLRQNGKDAKIFPRLSKKWQRIRES